MTDTLTVILVEDEALTVTITEEALTVNVTEVIDLSGGGDHTLLQNLDTVNQHPINAIIGLEDALLAKDTALANHVAAADPHTVYVLESLLDGLVTVIIAADPVVGANTTHRSSDGKDHSDVVLNNAKETNVPTELDVGTVNTTTVSITSDGGADDVTLPAATNAAAGVATAAQITKLEGIETGATGDQIALEVPFTPGGDLVAINVQGAIDELDDEKQPLNAKLTDIAGSSPAAGDFYVWDGAHVVPTIPSTFGQTILSQGSGSFPIWRDRMIVDVANGLSINEATNGPLLSLGLATSSSSGAASAAQITELEYLKMLLGDRSEPTGFIRSQPLTMGDISFVDGTRAFTINPQAGQPNFQVYCGAGGKFIKTSPESIVIDNVDGIHIFYYDNSGVLQKTSTWIDDLIKKYTIVAGVYWNSLTGQSIVFGDERHGVGMSGATHEYLHDTRGAKYAAPGLGINGLADASPTYTSIDSGQFFDEDIEHELSASSTHHHMYRLGTTGVWNRTAVDGNLAHNGGGNSYWNEWTGTTWQLTALSGGQFGLVHFMSTNDTTTPIRKITGTASYANRAAARAAVQTEVANLYLEGLPSAEWIFLYSMIITSNGDLEDNADGSLLVDFRGATLTGAAGASGTTTYHADLLDTATDGHPVTAITGLYYKQSFTDGSLVAGILAVTHSLNSEFPAAVTVWDNNGKIVEPDDVTSTGSNTLTVDLSSYGTITGTWNVSIIY